VPWLHRSITDDNYIAAVKLWLRGGTPEELVELLHPLPLRQLATLIAEPGWTHTANMYRRDVLQAEDAALSRLIHVALEHTAVRLQAGDEIVGKGGTIRVVKVKAKDAAAIAALFMERRAAIQRLLDGKPEEGEGDDLQRIFKVARALRAIDKELDPAEHAKPVDGSILVESITPRKVVGALATSMGFGDEDDDE
jgi:hypothetical protein